MSGQQHQVVGCVFGELLVWSSSPWHPLALLPLPCRSRSIMSDQAIAHALTLPLGIRLPPSYLLFPLALIPPLPLPPTCPFRLPPV
jgi:hypothetical protein